MEMALALAEKGRGRVSPNPMVGAMVVRDGEMVGKGFHARAGNPHAEIEALREAGTRAQGATLFVTLEPCAHHGKTPPCTQAIIAAGIQEVIYAMVDPNPLVNQKGIQELVRAGLTVRQGPWEEKAKRLNEAYIKYITTSLPFVLLKCAMSLDGKIATSTGESRWITGPEARALAHRMRDEVDAVMIGVGTALRDNPSLTARFEGARDPIRIVLDSQARLSPGCQMLTQSSSAPTWVVVVREEAGSDGRKEALKRAGAHLMEAEAKDGKIALLPLMKELGRRGITSLLLEGGGELNASAMEEGIVDKVVFFIAPILIGGKEAPSPLSGQGIKRIEDAWRLKDMTVEWVGQDLKIEGYRERQGA